jgi:hypothetical protein
MKGRGVMFLLIFQETATGAFDDLGKLLLGGVAAAIVLAIGFTLIRIRMRDKKPQTSNFISISSAENEKPSSGL